MKFTEHLAAHLTPEWRKQYVEYEALKELLYKALDEFEELPVVDAVTVSKHFDDCDNIFFAMCQTELEKINNFFAEKLAEAKRKFATLREECDRHISVKQRPPISAYINTPSMANDQDSLQGSRSPALHRMQSERSHINDMDLLRRRRNTFKLKKGEKKSEDTTYQVGQNVKSPQLKPHDLKLALSEFYLNLVLLQNYQSLNFTGFRKILKKHDKLFQRSNGLDWHRNTISNEPFYTDNSVDAMIAEVEDTFTNLEGGNRQNAMKRLRVPPIVAQSSAKSVFRFGLFLGIFLSEIICIIYIAVNQKPPAFSFPAFRLFRGTFLLIYYLNMMGVNIYGWRSSGVNHVLIFEIDPRSHLDHFQLIEMSMLFADLWGAGVIFYFISDRMQLPGYTGPFVIIFLLLLVLFLPFHVFQYKARLWLVKVLFRIVRAPLAKVRFPDFFLADQLNSLSFILPDLAYFLCFFISFIDHNMLIKDTLQNSTITPPGSSPIFVPKAGYCDSMMWGLQPILKALPAWWRFLQCLRRYRDLTIKSPVPHLLNAGKYSTTLIAILASAVSAVVKNTVFFILMVLAKILNSACTTTWDLVMDWGLLNRSAKENDLLRDELVYRFRAYYYVAIVEDVVIRFIWILPLAFSQFDVIDIEIITTIVMFAEVTRRIIWNFFRLENEHLNNCGDFRAVRDIGVAPIPRQEEPKSSFARGAVDRKGAAGLRLDVNQKKKKKTNNNNNSQTGGGGDDVDDDDDDDEALCNNERGDPHEDGQLLPTLAQYTNTFHQTRRKSLWNYLRETYFQSKKEKQRQLDIDAIARMEGALRAAKQNVPAETIPREVSSASVETSSGGEPVAAPQTPAHNNNNNSTQQSFLEENQLTALSLGEKVHHQPTSLVASADSLCSRRVMVGDRQCRAIAKATIPLTVCFLEPAESAENRPSNCPSPTLGGQPMTGLPNFPTEGPAVLLQHSEETGTEFGLDLVIAPEKLSLRQHEDSPEDTILPIRTRLLANQLRELLHTFNTQSLLKHEPSSERELDAPCGSSCINFSQNSPVAYRVNRAQTTTTTQKRLCRRNRGRSVPGCGHDPSHYEASHSPQPRPVAVAQGSVPVRENGREERPTSRGPDDDDDEEEGGSRGTISSEHPPSPQPAYTRKFTVKPTDDRSSLVCQVRRGTQSKGTSQCDEQ